MRAFHGAAIIVINGTPDVELHQIQNVRVDPRIDTMIQGASGIDTVFAGVKGSIPLIRFDTPAIAYALGQIGFNGLAIVQATNPVEIYFQEYSNGGSLATGSTATKFTINGGLAYLSSITATHQEEAMASFEIVATFDGTNAPIAVAKNQSVAGLGGFDQSNLEKFTLGPADFNGTAVETQSFEFNTGIEVFTAGKDGGLYAELAAIQKRAPSATINVIDLEAIADEGVIGAAKTNVALVLRKKTNKGGNVAEATAEHIAIEMPEALAVIGETGGGYDSEADSSIMVHPVWNGSDAMVNLDTAYAISA